MKIIFRFIIILKCLFISFFYSSFVNASSEDKENQHIRIVGSSTIYPFITIAAEEFGSISGYKTPIVESTGTGGGLKLFCSKNSFHRPQIVTASRKIRDSELDYCNQNKINNIEEIKLGYDGIILAKAKGYTLDELSIKQLFLAVAEFIPDNKGKLVKNYYKKWNEINADLPDEKIEIYGPASTSGTREAFEELVMEKACNKIGEFIDQYPDTKYRKIYCSQIRSDGAYIEIGENENLIINKINSNHKAIGIIGFNFLEGKENIVEPILINNISPTIENIGKKKYPLSRILYLYMNKQDALSNPSLNKFLEEVTSTKAIGPKGYLTEKGLIPIQ